MKNIAILVFLINILTLSAGQEINELEKKLQSVKDKEKVELLIKIAKLYNNEFPPKAIEYGKEAIGLARELNDEELEAKGLNTTAIALELTGGYDEAISCYEKAIVIREKQGKYRALAGLYNNIGLAYKEKGEYDKAIDSYKQAMEFAEKTNFKKGIARTLNNIGTVYISMRQPETALEFYYKSLEIVKGIGGKDQLANVYNNIANVLVENNKLDKALGYYQQALALFEELNDKEGMAKSLNNIGLFYFQTKEYDKALIYYNNSLNIKKEIGSKKGIINSYQSIAGVYSQYKLYSKAIEYLEKSLALAMEDNMKVETFGVSLTLSDLYKEIKDYKNAFRVLSIHSTIKDSIFNENNSKKLAEMEALYNLKDKEKENEFLKKQSETQKHLNYYLIAILAIFLINGLIFLRMYFTKKKVHTLLLAREKQVTQQKEELEHAYRELQNSKENISKVASEVIALNDKLLISEQQLKELNATKDKFFTIIAHDLKNPIGAFRSTAVLLSENFDQFNSNEIIEILENLKKFSNRLYDLLENLLQWSKVQTDMIEFHPEKYSMELLINSNIGILSYNADLKKISLNSDAAADTYTFCDGNMINTVLRNIISNAIKFTSEGGEVVVSAQRKGAYIETIIADNGIGISEDDQQKLFRIDVSHSTFGTANEKGTGLGLILASEFIRKNSGQIRVESSPGQGSKFIFSLPAAE